MICTSLDDILAQANEMKDPRRVAVVAAGESHTIEAVLEAEKSGIVIPLFVGNESVISRILVGFKKNPSDYKICNALDGEVATVAVKLVRSNQADFLMKGNVQTSVLLKAVLDKEVGLVAKATMSHLLLMQIPKYHKLLAVTDSAIAIHPDLRQKRDILQNAVVAMKSLGYDMPKVAVLTAVEVVNPKMQDTVDAAALKKMYEDGIIGECIVEGPISADLAFDRESAQIKGFVSQVVGEPDILLMPNIEAGNILVKSLRLFASASSVGIVLGSEVPIVLLSRGAPMKNKCLSIALAAITCEKRV